MEPLWNKEAIAMQPHHQQPRKQPRPVTLTCPTGDHNPVCPKRPSQTPLASYTPKPQTSSSSCPEYFRWIYEDLRHWSFTGITKEMIESAKRLATFRLVILDGRVYVEEYFGHGMTRNWFTLWSILQLLERYPGRVPDLELVFSCMDMPVVKSADYPDTPPPLFHYCKDNQTVDILFPDWSFWGCPEQNVRPWESEIKDIVAGNQKVQWTDRKPYAFWKGSKFMGSNRQDLMKCNVSKDQDWNARLYDQDWLGEAKQGYKKSNLADQCIYRYKIYVEGLSWSVSQKYILACNSPMLAITPHYDEFLSRGLIPGQHYWPINENNKCRSLKFAVDWGNTHQEEVQAMGNKGSRFIQEEIKMDYIYDYMLHVLTQYSKLLKFKPIIPERATEICLETMACSAEGRIKEFMMESMVKWTNEEEPCTMPSPFSPVELNELASKKANYIEQVDKLEQQSWDNRDKKY